MNQAAPSQIARLRLPQLAAMMLFFLGLSTNTHVDAGTAWAAQPSLMIPLPVAQQAKASDDGNDQIHVLSPRDAALYRSAFAAQEKRDWKTADDALAQITDKKLVGHVLADRYLRRDVTVAEAQQWLAAYGEFPEAASIYARARHVRGFGAASIAHPAVAALWTGNDGISSSSGFHSLYETETVSGRLAARINAALHRGDPMAAREILTTELQRGTVSTREAGDIVSHIAATFFREGQTERARDMARTAAAEGVPLGLWIDGLSAWKQDDFKEAARSFASLAQAPGLPAWDRAAASYWAYRAAKRMGDEVQARHWLAEAAKAPRTFYGYMAASLGGHAPDQSWKMPELTAKRMGILSSRSAGWQALALVQVGQNDLAESELRRLKPTGSRELENAVLALAEKAHMPALTLQLGGITTNDHGQFYEAAQYPLPPWQPAGGYKVDRALLYALMKHESHFDPDAVSQSGACGLMQIMPSTARSIANDNHGGRQCPKGLFDPATNIEMGQKYVRVLAGQPMIGNNLMLLLAAYNGGPGNLSRWLDGDNRRDPLLFVESLPVRETRDYVQQVLLHYWMYRARLAEPETSAAQLTRGEWPRYALTEGKIKQAANGNVEVASVEMIRVGGSTR